MISNNGTKQQGLTRNSQVYKTENDMFNRSLTLAKNVETKSLKRTSLSFQCDDDDDEDLKLMENQDLEALFMMKSSKRTKI